MHITDWGKKRGLIWFYFHLHSRMFIIISCCFSPSILLFVALEKRKRYQVLIWFFLKLILIVVFYLIDCSSQYGVLAGCPFQPLTGCWEGGQSHAPPVSVSSRPEAAPPRFLRPGSARSPASFRTLVLVVFGCSDHAQPTDGLLPYLDFPFRSGQTLGAWVVQLEKQI